MEYSPASIAVLDRNMNFIAVSSRWIKDFNLEGQEIIGRSHYDFNPEITNKYKEVHKRCLAGATEHSDGDKYVHADGSVKWIKWECHPLYSSSADIIGIIVITQDVTKEKTSEEALIKNEELIRSILNSTKDYVCSFDSNRRFTSANKNLCKILKLDKEEIIGKTPNELNLPPEMCREWNMLGDEVYRTDSTVMVFSSMPKKGEIHNYKIVLNPLHDDNDSIFGVSSIVSDITESIKAEERIKESLAEKEVLLREIHHRVKNNLQIISSFLNLQNQNTCDELERSILLESKNRIQTMALIHEQLYQSSSLKDISARHFINKQVYNLLYSYGANNIERIIDIEDLNMDLDTSIPCGLIINELVTNSIKYAFPEGEGIISVELKQIKGKYNLTIADNGIGLPENLDIISTETFGLKVVNALVEQLDGTIELEKNNGTKFKIIFDDIKYKDRI